MNSEEENKNLPRKIFEEGPPAIAKPDVFLGLRCVWCFFLGGAERVVILEFFFSWRFSCFLEIILVLFFWVLVFVLKFALLGGVRCSILLFFFSTQDV